MGDLLGEEVLWVTEVLGDFDVIAGILVLLLGKVADSMTGADRGPLVSAADGLGIMSVTEVLFRRFLRTTDRRCNVETSARQES